MSIAARCASLFLSTIGPKAKGLDHTLVASELTSLLPNNGYDIDLKLFLTRLNQEGLGLVVATWLGNSDNARIMPSQLLGILGNAPISQFAQALKLDISTIMQGLARTLPMLVDESSEHGALRAEVVFQASKLTCNGSH
ncbi:YidB family protein [Teredinibacter waterburyi]|jgi:Uncharacterized protein conserved in bacteria|uniref:YidB family protein n=1 Tax=Teredinibacter waterburyi TaxID=1500538 RepID=UPI00165FCB80|nr:YidB family protein [Teredinibacter waterburyi]